MTQGLAGVELEVGGVLLKFMQTAAETAGRLHVQEARYPALSAAPPLNDAPAVAKWETRPALRTAQFFQAMSRASHGRARPSFVEAAAILSEYREEFELAKPSPFIQRIVFGCLAPLGRRALRPVMP